MKSKAPCHPDRDRCLSLPLPGAWIEIFISEGGSFAACRSLYRERGLKSDRRAIDRYARRSLPLPGAWIEIFTRIKSQATFGCRSLYRERGLKSFTTAKNPRTTSRSLYRERGLKLLGGTVRLGVVCRSLYRERGLKFLVVREIGCIAVSLP